MAKCNASFCLLSSFNTDSQYHKCSTSKHTLNNKQIICHRFEYLHEIEIADATVKAIDRSHLQLLRTQTHTQHAFLKGIITRSNIHPLRARITSTQTRSDILSRKRRRRLANNTHTHNNLPNHHTIRRYARHNFRHSHGPPNTMDVRSNNTDTHRHSNSAYT